MVSNNSHELYNFFPKHVVFFSFTKKVLEKWDMNQISKNKTKNLHYAFTNTNFYNKKYHSQSLDNNTTFPKNQKKQDTL